MTSAERDAVRRSPAPPGQRIVEQLAVQHVGEPPELDRARHRVELIGALEAPHVFAWEELERLATTQIDADFHAATGWTVRGVRWRGVRLANLLARARPLPQARCLIVRDAGLYSASLSLGDASAPDVLLALAMDGAPLTRDHGGPVRLLAPAKYGFKSVKWVSTIEVRTDEALGFWESRGAHPNADPWREERFV